MHMGRRRIAQFEFKHRATSEDKKRLTNLLEESEFVVEHRGGNITIFKQD